jgi:hypothetical protein
MPRAKKRVVKRSKTSSQHQTHILYGSLAVLGGIVVGVVLLGLLMF